jgi:hypothetical protein
MAHDGEKQEATCYTKSGGTCLCPIPILYIPLGVSERDDDENHFTWRAAPQTGKMIRSSRLPSRKREKNGLTVELDVGRHPVHAYGTQDAEQGQPERLDVVRLFGCWRVQERVTRNLERSGSGAGCCGPTR